MGQMIVHDTDFSTPFASGSLDDIMGIKVPTGDEVFDEDGVGGKEIRFRRSGRQVSEQRKLLKLPIPSKEN